MGGPGGSVGGGVGCPGQPPRPTSQQFLLLPPTHTSPSKFGSWETLVTAGVAWDQKTYYYQGYHMC